MSMKLTTLHTMFLVLSVYNGNIHADEITESTTTAPQPLTKYQQLKIEVFESTSEYIQRTRYRPSCAGIGMITKNTGLERGFIFFEESSLRPICVLGMGTCFSYAIEEITCTCPPKKWDENGCGEKYKMN